MGKNYNYKIIQLGEKERKTILKKIAFAVRNLLPDNPALKTDLEKLDDSWKKLIDHSQEIDLNTAHLVLNSLGSYLGELFKQDFPHFEWKIFQDKIGSDLCLYFEHNGKDIIIYPVSSLYKGFAAKDRDCLTVYFNQTKEEIVKWMKG